VPTYLVESYLPRAGSSVAATAAALVGRTCGTRHRWSLLLPEEEICFHVFEGPSAEVVREATVRAELQCQRITEAVLISAAASDLEGASP
jgi:hypothetical protein